MASNPPPRKNKTQRIKYWPWPDKPLPVALGPLRGSPGYSRRPDTSGGGSSLPTTLRGRDHENEPWVANNGLRVERRSHQGFWLNWGGGLKNNELPTVAPSATVSGESGGWDQIWASDDVEGAWFHVQFRQGLAGEWREVYKGYRERIVLNALSPDTTYYFRMRRNGEVGWGSEIIAATDSLPPYADDIHQAVTHDSEDLVLRIIASTRGPKLRQMLLSLDPMGMTPLMIACQANNHKMVGLLLNNGSWPEIHTGVGSKTAVICAATGGSVQVMDMLEKAGGVQWFKRDNTGCHALHHATTAGNLGAVKYLLGLLGIQYLEDKDGFGWSPLLRAVIMDSPEELITYLLDLGADPNVVDSLQMKSCLISAAGRSGRVAVVRTLLEYGADPFYKNRLGETALAVAVDKDVRKILHKRMKDLTIHPWLTTGQGSTGLPDGAVARAKGHGSGNSRPGANNTKKGETRPQLRGVESRPHATPGTASAVAAFAAVARASRGLAHHQEAGQGQGHGHHGRKKNL